MKSDWSTVALKTVCEFKPPKAQIKKNLLETDEVSFAPMSDLGVLRMDFVPSEVRQLKSVYKGYTYFADGDVLCAKITPCFENGKMGIASGLKNGVGFGSSEFVVMRPSPKLLPHFLFYFLLRDEIRNAGARVMTGAVGHRRVPKEYFEDLQIPLPPLTEQVKIVAALDDAFASTRRAKALFESNLNELSELQQSLIQNTLAGGPS
jgi:type I restriction enzyme S subunit